MRYCGRYTENEMFISSVSLHTMRTFWMQILWMHLMLEPNHLEVKAVEGEGCKNKWILYSKMDLKHWLKIVFDSVGFSYYFSLLLGRSTANTWPTCPFKLMPLIIALATRIYKTCLLISFFFPRLCQFRTTWSLKVATQMALLQLLKYRKLREGWNLLYLMRTPWTVLSYSLKPCYHGVGRVPELKIG